MEKLQFTQRHVDLIEKWHGKKRDKNNVEQQKDFPELKGAYEIVEDWANAIKESLFPEGKVKLRKSPVNQGGHFSSYLWAKIYPTQNSPDHLAYTVHISTDEFAVKIDTVNAPKPLVEKYESIRGSYYQSPIVKCLSHEETLAMDFEQLVQWSNDAIKSFELSYDRVSEEIGISTVTKEKSDNTQVNFMDAYKPSSLNQILYGPPGTGKTYHTIEAAVKAAEPQFIWHSRDALKAEYDRLISEKRIRFVTFHQSYGYEEFVEGLAASSIDGQISYEVKSGIFKEICEQASRGVEQSNDPLEIAIEALKSELEEGVSLSLSTQRGKMLDIQYHGNTTFRAFPHETSHEDLGNGYPVSIDSIRKLYGGADAKEFYNPSYVKAILQHLVKTYNLPTEPVVETKEVKSFVLVIDEINRGNISKVFGELITLIEPSKRKGQEEALELTLPYSGKPFSVPDNLNIIGTMNTADRSLAMMDTALRRRFDFVEMMPKPELLTGAVVKGIDLQRLLDVLNQRIEILYDREHTLGHAFFMPVKALVEQDKQDLAFFELQSVFKNKIIPLLEEYFFEDWSKIRLVIADNQKTPEKQFIKEHSHTKQELSALFGAEHNLDQYGQSVVKYTLADKADEVWYDAESYIGLYSKASKTSDEIQGVKIGHEMVTEQ
ncbi:McrB family protein [Vibrio azureus]|uniref:Putative 5-methylcytosine-specific restriction enzyme n=1 Tax=Vibrio azureus NBRC 104587 TaxID=1219077 RepID=U3ASS0_9VIBR|nr:AAA family ATPase [Vibrio azureus]GAD76292.1 putative 5-methylcytosine-specific restriction enzyme [Vibrio azureus NBRC 104587]